MKRVQNGRRVLMGKVDTGTYNGTENRIHLFDGKFTTGYRVVSFRIVPGAPLTATEFMAKLSTEPKSTISTLDMSDVQEIAWAQAGVSTSFLFNNMEWIRDDNMVIEDLWISSYTTGTSPVDLNYEIVLEKYSFASWDGAGILVENLAQGGPA